jgi:hypothetical protein
MQAAAHRDEQTLQDFVVCEYFDVPGLRLLAEIYELALLSGELRPPVRVRARMRACVSM